MSSRRKRRAQKSSEKGKPTGSKWKWVAIAGGVLVLALIFGYTSVVRFLHSDDFRKQVGEKISEELGVPVELGKMTWSGLHMENPSFTAQSEGALEIIEANDIQLNVDTDFLKREVWEISDVQVQTAKVEIDLRKEFTTLEFPKKPDNWLTKMLPKKAVLLDAAVARADARIMTEGGEYKVRGVEVEIEHEDEGYVAKLKRGKLQLPFPILNEAKLNFAKVRMLNDRIVFDEADFDVFESGSLELDGEIDLSGEGDGYDLSGVLTGLKCADLIDEDWKQRLSGDVEAKLRISPKAGNEPEITGSVKINDGVLTALPVLDTIAAYTNTRDFQTLRFSEFRCDFHRFGNKLTLSNIYVHCDGLMRIEGKLTLNSDNLENGVFQVGLNPGTLSHIPGAEEKVFLPGKEGMHWTTVKVWGNVDDIQEDLTDRMKAAALDRMIEMVGGKEVLRFTNQAVENIGEVPNVLPGAETGEVIIDAGQVIIEGGSDLLDSVTDGMVEEPLKTGSDLIQSGLGGLFGNPPIETPEKLDEEKE